MSRSLAWVLVFGVAVVALWLSSIGRGVRGSYSPSNKGRLGSVRSAIEAYSRDNNGRFPAGLSALVPGYLDSIPLLWDGKDRGRKYPHPPTREVVNYRAGEEASDTGKWAYFNDPADRARWGNFIVGCTHADKRGAGSAARHVPWSSF